MATNIHFFGIDPDRSPLPLARAFKLGKRSTVTGVDERRFHRLAREAPRRWAVTGPEEANLFIYPYHYSDNDLARQCEEQAKQLGKPCLFFHLADAITATPPMEGDLFRMSMLASERQPHEHVLPAFTDDLARETGGFEARPWNETPSVGFCGYVGSRLSRLVYHLQGRQQKVLGLSLRHQALNRLSRTRGLETHFIRRTQFWGGAVSWLREPSVEDKQRIRDEYLDNLIGADYTLCLRGAGNFSYRFYETLSVGRIPLFVNTDCELPFADEIDWRLHVVWVEEQDLPRLGERLKEFHAALSPKEFEQIQRSNRRLWEERLRPTECYQQVIDRTLARRQPQEAASGEKIN